MTYNEIVGTIGVGLVLVAYFCNVFAMIPKEGKLFFALNIVGAGLACYASVLIGFWPFVVLEGVWTGVSVLGMLRIFHLRSEKT